MPCRRRPWLLAAVVVLIAACGKQETPPAEAPASGPAASAPPASAPQAAASQASAPQAAASAPERVSLASVMLAKAGAAGGETSAPTEIFAPGDTVQASVDTEGAGSATLGAKWTLDKKRRRETMAEVTVSIAPTGPLTTVFGLARPGGLPPGDYQLEIVLDGQAVATRTFKVQRAIVARREPPAEKPQAPPAASGMQPSSSAQLHAASLVYYGAYECELGQTMNISRNRQGGYVDLQAGRYRATLTPVLSPTGAVRLEQVSGGALLVVQIPSKSILFNQKAGKRLIDDCRHAQQKIEAAAAAREQNSLGMNLPGQVPNGVNPATAAAPR